MAKNTQPIAKRCRALGISPAVMGYAKKNTNRNPGGQMRKKKSEYVKMEHSFRKSDVSSASIVSHSDAVRSVEKGGICKQAGLFTRLFRKTLVEVTLKDGKRYYFEMMDPKKFIDMLR